MNEIDAAIQIQKITATNEKCSFTTFAGTYGPAPGDPNQASIDGHGNVSAVIESTSTLTGTVYSIFMPPRWEIDPATPAYVSTKDFANCATPDGTANPPATSILVNFDTSLGIATITVPKASSGLEEYYYALHVRPIPAPGAPPAPWIWLHPKIRNDNSATKPPPWGRDWLPSGPHFFVELLLAAIALLVIGVFIGRRWR